MKWTIARFKMSQCVCNVQLYFMSIVYGHWQAQVGKSGSVVES